MFNVRLFLRNHSPNHRWAELPAEVKRLFGSPGGSLVWSEFYIADPKQGRYFFEFLQGGSSKPKRYRADIVMVQETWGLLTLIEHPRKRGQLVESISLDAASIESAVFKIRKGGKARR